MFKNVIVGVDELPGGRDAIALALELVAKDGGLTLVYVYLGDEMPVRGSNGAFEASERDRGLALLAQARVESRIDAELLCTGSPSVGRGLHELVQTRHADLLVVGSTHRGLIGRVLVGDDTRDALNGAPCAVAVAPAAYSQRPAVLCELGVGYNASPESEDALAVAQELAAESGARVSAFQALSLPPGLRHHGAGAEEMLEEFVEDARALIAAHGNIEPHAGYGIAAEELALYSASVDLLVIGSRNYGPIGRLVHGSTSQRLARTARCPLLVLPRADHDRQPPAGNDAARQTASPAAA